MNVEDPADFTALVEMAMAGEPGPLQHALRILSARLRRPLAHEDYPECVHKMFEAFAPFAGDNGGLRRGRPSKSNDQNDERIRLAYRAWVASLVRDDYEKRRLLIQITKETGGHETVDGRPYPMDAKPSDHAHQEIGYELGVGPDAIKKLLRLMARKKGTPQ